MIYITNLLFFKIDILYKFFINNFYFLEYKKSFCNYITLLNKFFLIKNNIKKFLKEIFFFYIF